MHVSSCRNASASMRWCISRYAEKWLHTKQWWQDGALMITDCPPEDSQAGAALEVLFILLGSSRRGPPLEEPDPVLSISYLGKVLLLANITILSLTEEHRDLRIGRRPCCCELGLCSASISELCDMLFWKALHHKKPHTEVKHRQMKSPRCYDFSHIYSHIQSCKTLGLKLQKGIFYVLDSNWRNLFHEWSQCLHQCICNLLKTAPTGGCLFENLSPINHLHNFHSKQWYSKKPGVISVAGINQWFLQLHFIIWLFY